VLGKTVENTLKIHRATPDDLPAIAALERRTNAAAHWSEQQYQSILDGADPIRVILVGDRQGELNSFLVARVLGAEWELENIAVSAALQRQGVGTALLQAMMTEARSAAASSVLLEVRESNLPARRLYAKVGFAEEGRRKAYYRDPVEDAILYRLMVSP
jgi:ribosomal-protein-alanine N-acetyltransferase